MERNRRAERILEFGPSVWLEIARLVEEHKPVDLSKGFPNWPAPEFLKDAASAAVTKYELNQYTRAQGHPRLVNAIASTFGKLLGKELDPMKNVLCTVGAAESLYCTFMAFINPGDEVILMEPFFDFYPAQIKLAGGVPVYIPLEIEANDGPSNNKTAKNFKLDLQRFEKAITPRTKMVVINSPHNPTGKIFSKKELEEIAEIVKKHELLLLSDEVYEWLVFDEEEHVRPATLPGMWDRTITVGSAGKTFSVTGWKVGWVIAPANLVESVWMVHQYTCFTIVAPLQEAIAIGFEEGFKNGYFEEYPKMMAAKRDKLVTAAKNAGLDVFVPQGSYFLFIDTSKIKLPLKYLEKPEPRDFAMCRYFIQEFGIATIPPSAFYCVEHQHLAQNFLRLCFCKTDDILDLATEKFKAIGKLLSQE